MIEAKYVISQGFLTVQGFKVQRFRVEVQFEPLLATNQTGCVHPPASLAYSHGQDPVLPRKRRKNTPMAGKFKLSHAVFTGW